MFLPRYGLPSSKALFVFSWQKGKERSQRKEDIFRSQICKWCSASLPAFHWPAPGHMANLIAQEAGKCSPACVQEKKEIEFDENRTISAIAHFLDDFGY